MTVLNEPDSRIGVPLLEVRGFTVRFGEVVANKDVCFDVAPGEIHALVGENGAGKSTLLKLIYGVYRPDSGDLLVDGEPADITSPATARGLGIGMVFQDLRLVEALTVAENIALSLPGGVRLRLPALEERIRQASAEHGLLVDPGALVRHLSIGERQRVEILKVLMTGARIVVLDEPTSVLAPQEVASLFEVMRSMRAQGYGVVIVTHKLGEVRTIADRVTVLRAGCTVMSGARPEDHDDAALVEAMVGRAVPALPEQRVETEPQARVMLALSGVSAKGDRGHLALHDVHVEVRAGEMVGVAGVAGSGQRELCEVALGLRDVVSGTVRIGEQVLERRRTTQAIKLGACGLPEDPVRDAVVAGLSVLEHMALSGEPLPRSGAGIRWSGIAEKATAKDARVGLRMAGLKRRVKDLSGGNIQRVLLTRVLGGEPDVLVVAYPSRGLDIANTRRTQEQLLARRAAGAAVLVVSEDLEELMSLCDRIVVLHDGHVSGTVDAADADRYLLGRLMLGGAA
jgi:simple sugar transport system ATP-binding protein